MSTEIVRDGKNKFQIQCPHCSSRILCEQTGAYLKQEMQVPKPDCVEETFETLEEFWKVESLMTFENIGMTKPSPSGVRYLTCCDCERGPLGIFDSPNDTAFVAIARVKNEPDSK
ncbi:guanine nucleotide exchange factor MSS4 homolog [Galendromus occidentalis]|uniref:Guanine nucleotide exchange factor MSS4 homolog n=1 Tax=Galendromus occidentalis TaxID=34638 RepID=A0AAJ6VZE3_9ACAR|nr:guanine nucleotide exchange factor MSS4 homolog [Galendromus occidentalis]